MFTKFKLGVYDYFDKKSIKRYSKFYVEHLVRKNEKYNAVNMENLIKDIRKYYKNIETEQLYYVKKKLKLKINNYTDTDLMTYLGILISIAFVCMTTMSSALLALNNSDKSMIIDVIIKRLTICALASFVFVFIVQRVNTMLNRKYDKSFDIMCLDILEDIEKEFAEEQEHAKEESKKLEIPKAIEQYLNAKNEVAVTSDRIIDNTQSNKLNKGNGKCIKGFINIIINKIYNK